MKKQNKTAKIWRRLPTIAWAALLAAELIVAIQILLLDMLPVKFLLPVLALLVLTAVAAGMLLHQRQGKWQKKRNRTPQYIGYALSAVGIIGCVVASSAISQVRQTINTVTQVPVVEAIVDVYVLNEDKAQSIEEAKDYTFAVTDSFDWKGTQSALEGIQKQTGKAVKTVNYPSVFAMVDALYAKEVDALIVNNAYISLLSSLDPYDDFTDRAKMIYSYTVEKLVPVTTEPPAKATENTEQPGGTTGTQGTEPPTETTEPENPNAMVLYISGYDSYGSRLYKSCSDVNILAVVNLETKQILLVNTPRDYYIPNPAGNGELDKLTHCGLYGVEYSVEALEDLYDINISYYAQINFSGFIALVDAVGGVVVNSDVSFSSGGYSFYVGKNYLDGRQALWFARARKQFAGGDHVRGRNQMKVIQGLIDKLSAGTILTNYSKILDSVKGMFATNMPQEKIAELVKMQLDDMAKWTVQSYAVTGENGSGKTYSIPSMTVYIMLPHEEKVEYASGLIERVLRGEILTDADLKGK